MLCKEKSICQSCSLSHVDIECLSVAGFIRAVCILLRNLSLKLNLTFNYIHYIFTNQHLCVCVSPGGHDNFRKMIDEAEPLGYPVVVKNARGHRGKSLILEQLCV